MAATPLHSLIGELLRQTGDIAVDGPVDTLDEWIADKHRHGNTYQDIAQEIRTTTGQRITHETVRMWHRATKGLAAPESAEAPHVPPTAGPQPPTPRTENQP